MIDSLAPHIEDAYERLGHQWGWRFMATPASTLAPHVDLAFVGLNPAGSTYGPPILSVEEGNAYRLEGWAPGGGPNALQVQVLRMYGELAKRWRRPLSVGELMDTTLAAHFCPFRSPSWQQLASRRESIEFSQGLWRDLLAFAQPRVMVCFAEGERLLAPAMESAGMRMTEPAETGPIGWGAYTYSLARYESARGRTLMVRIPHLSRFKIFGRPESREAIERFTTAAAEATAA
ncbi:MAG: hypothetical protein ACRDL0_02875 [Thermoleophilaceae bacterium]